MSVIVLAGRLFRAITGHVEGAVRHARADRMAVSCGGVVVLTRLAEEAAPCHVELTVLHEWDRVCF